MMLRPGDDLQFLNLLTSDLYAHMVEQITRGWRIPSPYLVPRDVGKSAVLFHGYGSTADKPLAGTRGTVIALDEFCFQGIDWAAPRKRPSRGYARHVRRLKARRR
ncbi:MAG: hypothetical protein HXX10_07480 [Rhodoplanes sp.]|uniref:hypothetical protein n=1 Tax=Rhodoplanes sp. TaxID=1968906 RepID=UPI001834CCCC|nr:hypothetical protein [Rhodoplanes sp.]NVO13861.1 hypothetical protein [Rhodoplanes sp.]